MLAREYEPASMVSSKNIPTGRQIHRPEEDTLRLLFEGSGALLAVANFEGRFEHLSPAWEEVFGKALCELLSTPWIDRVHPEDRERTRTAVSRLLREDVPVAWEGRFRDHDGGYRWLEWEGRTDDARHRVFLVAVDVTERRRAESERDVLMRKLEEKHYELERFTQTLSQDLKSPLLTIRGFLAYIERNAVDGNVELVRDDLARITEAVDRMKRFLDELTELSRMGRIINSPEGVQLSGLAREATDLLAEALAERGAEVVIDPDLPSVCGDKARLREVYHQLLDNAVRHLNGQECPRIEVGGRRDGDEVLCWVRDNGSGIDRRFHERIFGLFEKLDPQAEGSGIGLAVAKRIVEVHGGRIWVESEGAGTGSSFYFTLPG